MELIFGDENLDIEHMKANVRKALTMIDHRDHMSKTLLNVLKDDPTGYFKAFMSIPK
jgi:hypothetical protein